MIWRKKNPDCIWEYILNIIIQVQNSVMACHRPCLLFCVNPSQNAFKGWFAKICFRFLTFWTSFFPFLPRSSHQRWWISDGKLTRSLIQKTIESAERAVCGYTDPTRILVWIFVVDLVVLGLQAQKKMMNFWCAVQQLGNFWSNFWYGYYSFAMVRIQRTKIFL